MKFVVPLVLMQCALVSAAQQSSSETDPVTLDEVEVKAGKLIVGHDKIMLNVDKDLRKHSYDGYSMLNAAMIPGLEVNPFDRTVRSENQNVLLCINGIPASQGEIRTLNPKDVTRIDFYTGYDPRNPQSRFTLDFIVKIRESGGAVVLDARQHLNKITGSDMADWRMYRGKTELGVRLEDSYDTYAQGRHVDNEMSMAFDSGDVRISSVSSVDLRRSLSLRAKPYLVVRGKDDILKLSFALQHRHERQEATDLENYMLPDSRYEARARISTCSDRLLPSLGGQYTHKYSKTRQLSLFFGGNFSHTDNSRDYRSAENVNAHTHETFYGGSASVMYSFGLAPSNNGYVTASGAMNHSTISYDENSSASVSRLTTGSLRIAAGDNWRVSSSLSLNLMLAGEIISVDNSSRRSEQISFIPNFRVRWTPAGGHTLSYNLSIKGKRPPMSYYSDDEKWISPYIRQTGNPDLRMSTVTASSLSYRNVRGWGYLEVFGSYSGTTRSVYYDIRCDNQRRVYVQTFRNGGTYHDLSAGPRLQVAVVPKHLTVRVGGAWNYVGIVTYRPMHRHSIRANAEVMFMTSGFTANVRCSTPSSNLDELGDIGHVPWSLRMSAGYVINNISIGATVENPFMTAHTTSEHVLQGISESARIYSPRNRYNMVAITVGYRFGYGKEKKKYEEVELQEGENSAILGH